MISTLLNPPCMKVNEAYCLAKNNHAEYLAKQPLREKKTHTYICICIVHDN